MSKATRDKELNAKIRLCLDKQLLHVRAGDWWWRSPEPVAAVRFIGHASDLHGTVCTCCPPRTNP